MHSKTVHQLLELHYLGHVHRPPDWRCANVRRAQCPDQIRTYRQLVRYLHAACDKDATAAGAATIFAARRSGDPKWIAAANKEFPAVCEAIALHENHPRLAIMLQSLILVNEAPDQIATDLAVPLPVVQAYELLCYDVRDRLNKPLVIYCACKIELLGREQVDEGALCRCIAFQAGRAVIREYFGLPPIAGLAPADWARFISWIDGRLLFDAVHLPHTSRQHSVTGSRQLLKWARLDLVQRREEVEKKLQAAKIAWLDRQQDTGLKDAFAELSNMLGRPYDRPSVLGATNSMPVQNPAAAALCRSYTRPLCLTLCTYYRRLA